MTTFTKRPNVNPFLKISLPPKGKARDRRLKQEEFLIFKKESEVYGGY